MRSCDEGGGALRRTRSERRVGASLVAACVAGAVALSVAPVVATAQDVLSACNVNIVSQNRDNAAWRRANVDSLPAAVRATWPWDSTANAPANVVRGRLVAALADVVNRARAAFDVAKVEDSARAQFLAHADTIAALLDSVDRAPTQLGRLLPRLDLSRFKPLIYYETDGLTTTTALFARPPAGVALDPTIGRERFAALCFSAIGVARVLAQVRATTLAATQTRLAEIDANWARFAGTRRPQTPLEWLVNRARWRVDDEVNPPAWQLTLLHPVAAVLVEGFGSGDARRPGVGTELLGVTWFPDGWKWRDYVGLSVMGFAPQTGPSGIGGYVHLSRYLSVGAVHTGAGRWSAVLSLDALRWLERDKADIAAALADNRFRAKVSDVVARADSRLGSEPP